MCSCGGSRRSGLAPNNPELINRSLRQKKSPVVSYQLPKIVTQQVVTKPVISQHPVVTKPVISPHPVVTKPVVVQLLQSNRPVHSGNLPGLRR